MMDFINIVWIFLLISSLAPMVKQKVLDSERLRLMRRIEENRGSLIMKYFPYSWIEWCCYLTAPEKYQFLT